MKRAYVSVLPSVLILFPLLARTEGWMPFSNSRKSPETVVALKRSNAINTQLEAINSELATARQFLITVPVASSNNVVLAVQNPVSKEIDSVAIDKQTFLKRDAQTSAISGKGDPLNLRVIRANGVNTAVEVQDTAGKEWIPLVVKYPIDESGKTPEIAYYSSMHPALESNALTSGGQNYINEMLSKANAALVSTGINISPDVVKVAERLCIVEHTDHQRFMTENRSALFSEISGLYALNSGDTYRYSVSTAGAGGMIQMIPATYEAIRLKYPDADLQPDFVEGMRNHANALKAMLLYMQDTWDYLEQQESVRTALESHIASQADLLAAGYNSNPRKLSGYLVRGGSSWRELIPAETQIYLKIYGELDNYFENRAGE
jgi:hypothetical protein